MIIQVHVPLLQYTGIIYITNDNRNASNICAQCNINI